MFGSVAGHPSRFSETKNIAAVVTSAQNPQQCGFECLMLLHRESLLTGAVRVSRSLRTTKGTSCFLARFAPNKTKSLSLVHMLNHLRFPAASQAVGSLGVMDENGSHERARFRIHDPTGNRTRVPSLKSLCPNR